MTVKVNLSGINELDFPTGVTSATTAGGVTTINIPSATPPAQVVFSLASGVVANPSAWALVPRASSTITTLKMLTITSDGTTDLTFDILKNGTSILTAPITITHGTAANTVTTSTALTSSPLALAQDDVMSLKITSGTSSWTGTIQLE